MEFTSWPWQSLPLFSTLSLVFMLHSRRKGKELPPGPPALLFLVKFLALRRSIFDLPQLLRELHARHGPVISVRLFRPLVFISDRHLAHRVLVQSGATFAHRLDIFEPGLLFTSGARNINAAPYGPYWRLVRRNLATVMLHPARVGLFAPARRRTRDGLLGDLLAVAGSRPVTVRPLLRRAMFELIVYMSFGAWLGPEVLDEIQELQLWIVRSILSYPIFYLCPFLTKRLFRKRWAAHMAVRRRLCEIFVPLIHARRLRDDDTPAPCYADSLLALRLPEEGDRPLTDDEVVSLCSEFLSAGNDGTATVLEWIMAELVNRPDMQARVYEEVRSKPELSEGDLQALPYLNAVVLEALRLHPPVHFLIPHGVQSDGAEIGGYRVPRGAEVNILIAEVGRDETVWTAAREFRPERFLDGGEGCDVDVTGRKEIKMMPFGAGRRICPGYTLGMLHVAYLVAGLVRELEWLPPADGEQVDMTEVLEFTTVMKQPLRARAIPRS
ncbi:cytochrome P450 89A2-like [Aegilops tauschii subsp. strangulata]|nr:cytochrome P450 89A2-like [Aegilops tauschii subsp. strangulata]